MKSSRCYFHIKIKILPDFRICISAPFLLLKKFFGNFILWNLCCNYIKKNIFHFMTAVAPLPFVWLNILFCYMNHSSTERDDRFVNHIYQYMPEIKALACRINTNFNCMNNGYSNCIPRKLWNLMKAEFWEKIHLEI